MTCGGVSSSATAGIWPEGGASERAGDVVGRVAGMGVCRDFFFDRRREDGITTDGLPAELLLLIVPLLRSKRDLLSLRAASKRVPVVLTPPAFQQLKFFLKTSSLDSLEAAPAPGLARQVPHVLVPPLPNGGCVRHC
jgi:hypothetical protein